MGWKRRRRPRFVWIGTGWILGRKRCWYPDILIVIRIAEKRIVVYCIVIGISGIWIVMWIGPCWVHCWGSSILSRITRGGCTRDYEEKLR